MTVLKVPDMFNKIQDAIDKWQQGDVVRVSQGTFVENIKLRPGVILEGGFKSDFSAQNWTQWPSVIDGNQLDSVVIGADGCQLNGFTMRNGKAENGGGIFLEKASMTTIKNNIIEDNIAEYDGGGLYIAGYMGGTMHPYLDIHNNIIRRNKTLGIKGGCGGGIFVRDSKGGIRIFKNIIGGKVNDGNTSKWDGGGICVEGTSIIDIEDNEISHNITEIGHGGGVEIHGGTANSSLSKNKIHYNLSRGNYGGGVYVVGGTFISKNSIMSNMIDNFRLGRGGGIAVSCLERLTPIVENNFIYNNFADYGGGIHVDRGDRILIINNTIAFNRANPDLKAGGGVHVESEGRCILLNNIVWENKDDFMEVITGACILDHNDIEDGDGLGKNGNISSDPKFVSPPYDLHIKSSSGAIDGGNPKGAPKDDIDDERRSPKPDIGADEFIGEK
jgi:Right handed beta helix region